MKTQTRREDGRVRTQAEMPVLQPPARDGLGSPEFERGRGGLSPE